MSEAAKLDEFVEGMGDELSEDQRRALRDITRAVAIPDEVSTALTPAQRDRLNHLEGVIKANFQGFVEVGLALKAIRDERLYIETHFTFEQYCRDQFELSRKVSYDKIKAADVVKLLEPVEPDSIVDGEFVTKCDTDTPPKTIMRPLEAHARKLAELPAEDRPEVWKRAVQRGIENHGRVTAKTVAEVVAEALGKRTDKALSHATRTAKSIPKGGDTGDDVAVSAFCDTLQAFLNEISVARLLKWKDVPKSRVLDSLRAVLVAIEME